MRLATIPALAAAAVILAACSPDPSSGTPPDVVGTWVGTYSFALADGSANPSTETLVITRQEDGLLWGYEQWEEGGKQMRDPLTGSLVDDGTGIVLTEPAGFYRGTIDGDTMTVVFTRVDAEQHTAFEVVLTRQ
ncbi:MAG: hypothetical protein Q7V58_03950 [Actinomycetota bacterium]|nr:hypothetical protein [Actinomycetota bacterium]